jgi:hypothetical protein
MVAIALGRRLVLAASGGDVPPDEPPHEPARRHGPARPVVEERPASTLANWADYFRERARLRRTAHLSPGEHVVIDKHQHKLVLAAPALRTVFGLVALVTPIGHLVTLVLFGLLVVISLRQRVVAPWPRVLVASAAVAVLVSLARTASSGIWINLALGGLIIWLLDDVLDWYSDRLLVTNRRLYRLYGVVVTHRPSMSLTGVAFIDVSVSPLGRIFHYGTLLLDSAAQRDAPLQRFDFLPDAIDVQREILRLRQGALPKYPTTPGVTM